MKQVDTDDCEIIMLQLDKDKSLKETIAKHFVEITELCAKIKNCILKMNCKLDKLQDKNFKQACLDETVTAIGLIMLTLPIGGDKK